MGALAAQGGCRVQFSSVCGYLFLFAVLKQDGVGKYCPMGLGSWNFSLRKGLEDEASGELPKPLV